jgi:hypothetical protein
MVAGWWEEGTRQSTDVSLAADRDGTRDRCGD